MANDFEAIYRRTTDPWSFATDAVELGRYDRIVAALDRRRFQRAFEPACSVGVLTARLAGQCDELLALDVAPTAVEQARMRCAAYPHVTVAVGAVPEDIPPGPFDLIVFSELGYYFRLPQLAELVTRLADELATDGRLVACHWTGRSSDHELHGDVVHQVLDAHTGLVRRHAERLPTYVLAVYEPAGRP